MTAKDHFCKSFIEFDFSNVYQYYDKIASIIRNDKKEILERSNIIQEELKKKSDEKIDEFINEVCFAIADDSYISEKIEETFCNSMIILIYTLIEKSLKNICINCKGQENYIKFYNIEIKKKPRKSDIEILKKYIKQSYKIVFCSNDSGFLIGINTIRNVIAHKNGDLFNVGISKISRIKKLFKNITGFKMDKRNGTDKKGNEIETYANIKLELEFIDYCLKQVQQMFDNIFKKLWSDAPIFRIF